MAMVATTMVMIMIMVVMSLASEKHRQKEHETDDEGWRVSVTQPMSSQKRIEGYERSQSPSTEMISEQP